MSAGPLEGGAAPAWASAWGEDRHGVYAAFVVEGVEHRMRWIPPGRFTMGSPDGERGRWDDEGPQHEVVLTEGYWLGETPVTQALWFAVTGSNPSRFQGLDRPVERVSWNDAQDFVKRLNARLPGLEARLPTEAEWERACRGGTTRATWLGANNQRTLNAIAWWGDNSGDETHPVGQKAVNPYGLYDMLGNVWEWCGDAMRRYDAAPVRDPYDTTSSPFRVRRGGSWLSDAWFVRAAYRVALEPSIRDDDLGLRLARSRSAPGEAGEAGGTTGGRRRMP